jgi:hypothetical protein
MIFTLILAAYIQHKDVNTKNIILNNGFPDTQEASESKEKTRGGVYANGIENQQWLGDNSHENYSYLKPENTMTSSRRLFSADNTLGTNVSGNNVSLLNIPNIGGATPEVMMNIKVAAPSTGVFVGSAWQRAGIDLARGFQSAQSVGYHVHPNGIQPLKDSGLWDQFTKQFGVRQFVFENDIEWLSLNNGMYPLIADISQETGMALTGIHTNLPADRLVNETDIVIAELKKWLEPAKQRGIPVHLLFQVASPEAIRPDVSSKLRNEDIWIRIAKESGMDGIALDHPAMHYAGNIGGANDIALRVAQTSKEAGLDFVWYLNGASSVSDTNKLINDLKAKNIRVDNISVSHFENELYSGTGQESVDAQALEAIKYFR